MCVAMCVQSKVFCHLSPPHVQALMWKIFALKKNTIAVSVDMNWENVGNAYPLNYSSETGKESTSHFSHNWLFFLFLFCLSTDFFLLPCIFYSFMFLSLSCFPVCQFKQITWSSECTKKLTLMLYSKVIFVSCGLYSQSVCLYCDDFIFKGTVQRDFRLPVFFIIQTSLYHWSIGLNIFDFG